MIIWENADAQTIDEGNNWQMIYTAGDWTTGLVNGMTFQDGAQDTVSGAYADAGAGQVTVTAAGHPFAVGEIVSISGTTNYDSVYEIDGVTTDTFEITETFNAEAAAGTVRRSGNLTVTNAGIYKVVYHVSEAPTGINDIFDFVLFKNDGLMAGSTSRHESKTAGKYSTVAGCDIVAVNAGDIMSFAVKNTVDTDNITIRYAHISIFQL
jgi:hypothetical protein